MEGRELSKDVYIFHLWFTNTPIGSAKEWLVSVYKAGETYLRPILVFVWVVTMLFSSYDSSVFIKGKSSLLWMKIFEIIDG